MAQTDDSTSLIVDSIVVGNDSLQLQALNKNRSALDVPIDYQADDSIVLDLENERAYLYGNAVIVYEDITLKADYIIIAFGDKTLYATGVKDDSTGAYVGRPQFTDDDKLYEADSMMYNFETKKGLSIGVITTESDGYIHGEKVLRDSLENIFVKGARYTTCNLPEPHFYIQADKIKVIPKKQIVTGPANLVIEGINTPLIVPFGFFPLPDKKTSGLIMPSFQESQNLGFALRGLGYYLPVNDYIDVMLTADLYMRGSWALGMTTRYKKRYHYNGDLSLNYSRMKFGEPEIPSEYSVDNDIKLVWNYSQDPKAKPGRTFSAKVYFVTGNFLKNNSTNFNDLITTTSTSSVNYGKRFLNNKLNLNVNSSIYQNLSTHRVDFSLPQLTLNLSRQMPFKNALVDNPTLRSFVRNLGVSYSGKFKNEINVMEETLFKREVLDSLRNGVSHSIPITTSFKAFKWFNISPNFQFDEFWYFMSTEKVWDNTLDTLLIDNYVQGFERAHQFSFSMSMTTIIYGQKNFRRSPVKAIRHVVRPSMNVAWNPDFSKSFNSGYREVRTALDSLVTSYNIFERGNVGRPTFGPQGSLNFSIGNNLEMKIKSKDTTNGGIKKIKLIESMNLSSGYNFLADSFELRNLSINANTTLFGKVRVVFTSTLDPYAYKGDAQSERRINEFAWVYSRQLLHTKRSTLSIATNLNPDALKRKENPNIDPNELEYINNNLDDYIDFTIPWGLQLNYNLSKTNYIYRSSTIDQTIGIQGDLSLTQNWKILFKTGYDLTDKEIALTSFDIHRNLHCWDISFQWYTNIRPQYIFSIKVKPGSLEDLKLSRRRSWWDL